MAADTNLNIMDKMFLDKGFLTPAMVAVIVKKLSKAKPVKVSQSVILTTALRIRRFVIRGMNDATRKVTRFYLGEVLQPDDAPETRELKSAGFMSVLYTPWILNKTAQPVRKLVTRRLFDETYTPVPRFVYNDKFRIKTIVKTLKLSGKLLDMKLINCLVGGESFKRALVGKSYFGPSYVFVVNLINACYKAGVLDSDLYNLITDRVDRLAELAEQDKDANPLNLKLVQELPVERMSRRELERALSQEIEAEVDLEQFKPYTDNKLKTIGDVLSSVRELAAKTLAKAKRLAKTGSVYDEDVARFLARDFIRPGKNNPLGFGTFVHNREFFKKTEAAKYVKTYVTRVYNALLKLLRDIDKGKIDQHTADRLYDLYDVLYILSFNAHAYTVAVVSDVVKHSPRFKGIIKVFELDIDKLGGPLKLRKLILALLGLSQELRLIPEPSFRLSSEDSVENLAALWEEFPDFAASLPLRIYKDETREIISDYAETHPEIKNTLMYLYYVGFDDMSPDVKNKILKNNQTLLLLLSGVNSQFADSPDKLEELAESISVPQLKALLNLARSYGSIADLDHTNLLKLLLLKGEFTSVFDILSAKETYASSFKEAFENDPLEFIVDTLQDKLDSREFAEAFVDYLEEHDVMPELVFDETDTENPDTWLYDFPALVGSFLTDDEIYERFIDIVREKYGKALQKKASGDITKTAVNAWLEDDDIAANSAVSLHIYTPGGDMFDVYDWAEHVASHDNDAPDDGNLLLRTYNMPFLVLRKARVLERAKDILQKAVPDIDITYEDHKPLRFGVNLHLPQRDKVVEFGLPMYIRRKLQVMLGKFGRSLITSDMATYDLLVKYALLRPKSKPGHLRYIRKFFTRTLKPMGNPAKPDPEYLAPLGKKTLKMVESNPTLKAINTPAVLERIAETYDGQHYLIINAKPITDFIVYANAMFREYEGKFKDVPITVYISANPMDILNMADGKHVTSCQTLLDSDDNYRWADSAVDMSVSPVDLVAYVEENEHMAERMSLSLNTDEEAFYLSEDGRIFGDYKYPGVGSLASIMPVTGNRPSASAVYQ